MARLSLLTEPSSLGQVTVSPLCGGRPSPHGPRGSCVFPFLLPVIAGSLLLRNYPPTPVRGRGSHLLGLQGKGEFLVPCQNLSPLCSYLSFGPLRRQSSLVGVTFYCSGHMENRHGQCMENCTVASARDIPLWGPCTVVSHGAGISSIIDKICKDLQ